jgi:hypothetical protein
MIFLMELYYFSRGMGHWQRVVLACSQGDLRHLEQLRNSTDLSEDDDSTKNPFRRRVHLQVERERPPDVCAVTNNAGV